MISPSLPSPSAGRFQKDALLLKNAKRTTFHRLHKGPPSAQLHRHHQTRANYVISPAGAEGDPRMVGWRVIFKLSNNEESLIGGSLIVSIEINGPEECSGLSVAN